MQFDLNDEELVTFDLMMAKSHIKNAATCPSSRAAAKRSKSTPSSP
jgi:hypothetical protein